MIVSAGVSAGEYVAPLRRVTVALFSLAETCEKSTAPWDVTAMMLPARGSAERNSGVTIISTQESVVSAVRQS